MIVVVITLLIVRWSAVRMMTWRVNKIRVKLWLEWLRWKRIL